MENRVRVPSCNFRRGTLATLLAVAGLILFAPNPLHAATPDTKSCLGCGISNQSIVVDPAGYKTWPSGAVAT